MIQTSPWNACDFIISGSFFQFLISRMLSAAKARSASVSQTASVPFSYAVRASRMIPCHFSSRCSSPHRPPSALEYTSPSFDRHQASTRHRFSTQYTGCAAMSSSMCSTSYTRLSQYASFGTGGNISRTSGPRNAQPTRFVTVKCAARSRSVPCMVSQYPSGSARAFSRCPSDQWNRNGVGCTKAPYPAALQQCSSTMLISSPFGGHFSRTDRIQSSSCRFSPWVSSPCTTARKSISLLSHRKHPKASDPWKYSPRSLSPRTL